MDSSYGAFWGWFYSRVSQVGKITITLELYSKLGYVSPKTIEAKKLLNYVSVKSGQDHWSHIS